MGLKGNLRDLSLSQLLNLIHLANKTGALTIRGDNEAANAVLFFRSGKLVYGFIGTEPTGLLDLLLKLEKLTSEEVALVRGLARVGTDKEAGLLLMQAGLLSRASILESVGAHVSEIACGLFFRSSGEFVFEPNQAPPDDRITSPVHVDDVIVEGTRRTKDLEKLEQAVPNLDLTLRFLGHPRAEGPVVNLSAEEWKFISTIDGHRTIRQAGALAGMDDFRTRRAVHALLSAGLVELAPLTVDAPPPAAPVPAPAPVKAAPPPPRGLSARLLGAFARR